ncbi:MAG: cupredoxin domain-containing protein [Dehalococcoidia bacterium]|uniref:cupredoxin domain-containing protein n=1 Tax=Candidatus Amarobacter glycogenicus TaxID=3140699 RepID=UPI0031375DAB|nr:cupredoxin domain-containing protein [Dehalococcoidia bacterium]MBK7329984.1 cupredoxin domain-containing protein [Dehalococcoidia bacterium]MBK8560016.1 cupredoxin domain-containing protein [Dehalococcoidia bacterium]MBK9544881.1 cupredoxin domain-containing protein [Dehalococcoidia bacterium]
MNARIAFSAAAAAALLISALFLSSCGSSDGDSANSGIANNVAGVPDGVPFVDQDSLKFIPTSLKVKVGDIVYFKNSETALHTVTIEGKNESGNMKKDAVFTWTPKTAGEYKITCDFHPQMKATITVE